MSPTRRRHSIDYKTRTGKLHLANKLIYCEGLYSLNRSMNRIKDIRKVSLSRRAFLSVFGLRNKLGVHYLCQSSVRHASIVTGLLLRNNLLKTSFVKTLLQIYHLGVLVEIASD